MQNLKEGNLIRFIKKPWPFKKCLTRTGSVYCLKGGKKQKSAVVLQRGEVHDTDRMLFVQLSTSLETREALTGNQAGDMRVHRGSRESKTECESMRALAVQEYYAVLTSCQRISAQ